MPGPATARSARSTSASTSAPAGRRPSWRTPANPYAWQNWRAEVSFPEAGYYEVWARATDDQGVMQPFAISWNPKGYLNNSLHRIALTVTG